MPTVAILDLDEPKVGIKVRLAAEVEFGLALANALRRQTRRPAPVALSAAKTRGSRTEEQARAVKAIDLDEDRTGVVIAVAHDDSRCPLNGTLADEGLDPKFGSEAHDARNLENGGAGAQELIGAQMRGGPDRRDA